MPLEAVVLAAGKGTRMKSRTPKVLHKVLGLPMVDWVLEALPREVGKVWVVVGSAREAVEEALGPRGVGFVHQREQRGTGDAVRVALPSLSSPWVLVAPGDMPLLRRSSLETLVESHFRGGYQASLLTARLEDPTGYGRVVREGRRVVAIVEETEVTARQREIKEVNTGVYLFSLELLREALPSLVPHPPKGELYLTDVISWAASRGRRVGAVTLEDPWEGVGVNDRVQLAQATAVLRDRKNRALLDGGVSMVDPGSVYVEARVEVGADSVIYPWVYLEGETRIGEGCVIRSHVRIADSVLGRGVTVLDASVIEGSRLAPGVSVGPMARLRPGTRLEEGAKVGNFVEVKKSVLGRGTKANHLAYIGDATLGEGVNVGAGTITCNYDGFTKHPTIIGDGVFIGSDTQLVAPVRVGDHALIGAGSTITKDVPENALALSRVPQKVIPHRGMLYFKKKRGGRE